MKRSRFWRVAIATTSAIALSAKAAFAMPAAIGVFGAIFTSIGAGTGITAAGVASAIFSAALSYAAQTLLGKMLTPDVKPKGIKQKLESGGDLPLSFILGEYCTAGKLAYVNEAGNNLNNMLVMVISLSELPVTSFSNFIYINGERCVIDFGTVDTDPDAPGADFHPVTDYYKNDQNYCWVRFYDGTQTTADPYLRSAFGADPDKPWTTDHVGRGCAYAVVVCRYSAKGVWSGIPEFKFVLKGIPLYDPRKDSSVGGSGTQRWQTPSTWTYSENPKVMIYNIIRGIYYKNKWVWGGQNDPTSNVDAYCLPLSYWFAAMNHCDENVTLAAGGTIKRYTAGCEIEVDHQPLDIIKELDKSCAGYTTEYGGLWKTWAGPPGSSVLSFTDDDIVISEEQTDNLFRPLQELYNGAHATYVNQNGGWVMKDAPPRMFPDLQAKDGYQLIAEMQFPYVTSANQVQRLMRAMVLDSRRQITHVLTLPPSAYIDEPFEVNNWNSARNGYVNKKLQVTSQDDQPNCNQLMAFRETNPSDYDWNVSYELPDSVGVLKPVKPAALALDFTVVADQVDSPSGGKDRPAIRLNWTWGARDIDLRWVKYEIRLQGTTKVIKDGTFRNVDEATRTITSSAFRFGKTYQVRLFAQPDRRGRQSAWTGWKTVTCVIVDVPSAPTLTRVIQRADDGTQVFFMDIAWTAVAGDANYVARVVTSATTRRYPADDNSRRISVISGNTYTVDVATKASDGTLGDWSPTATITISKKNVNDVPNVINLTVAAGHRRNKIDYDDVDDDVFTDYRTTCIWRSLTTARPTNPFKKTKAGYYVDDAITIGTPYYYWAAHKDKSGQLGAIAGPVSSAAIKIQAGEYAAGSIVDADTTTSAPPVPGAVTISQYNKDLNGDGTVDIALKIAFTVPAGAKGCVLQISDGTETWYEYPKKSPFRLKFALVGVTYSVAVASVGFNNVESAFNGTPTTFTPTGRTNVPATIGTVGVFQMFYGVVILWDYAAEKDYAYTEVQSDDNALFTSPYVDSKAPMSCFIDPLADTLTATFYRLRNVSASGAVGAWRVLDNLGAGYKRGLIEYFDITGNAISNFFTTGTNTSVACAAGTAQLVESLGVTYFDGTTYVKSNYIEVDFEFRNNSGGARTMDITLEDAATAGASVLRTWPSVVLQDGNVFKSRVVVQSHTGTSKTFRLRVNMTAAGSVIRTRLDGMVRNR